MASALPFIFFFSDQSKSLVQNSSKKIIDHKLRIELNTYSTRFFFFFFGHEGVIVRDYLSLHNPALSLGIMLLLRAVTKERKVLLEMGE